jgi:hypothetical protein
MGRLLYVTSRDLKNLLLGSLALADVTDRFSQNAGNELPL